MTQGPEIAEKALTGILSGNPVVIVGTALVLALALAALIVSMMKKRDAGTLEIQQTREIAFQKHLEAANTAMNQQVELTREIAKCAAVQTSLLGQIQAGTQQTVTQMATWSDPEWLREMLAQIDSGVNAVHADVKVIKERGLRR